MFSYDLLLSGDTNAINPKNYGTKVGAHYVLSVPAGGSSEVRCRLYHQDEKPVKSFGPGAFDVFSEREKEADNFYAQVTHHLKIS